MPRLRQFWRKVSEASSDRNFLHLVENIEILIAKFLSILMIIVTLVSVYDLCIFMFASLLSKSLYGVSSISKDLLFEAFGLFLNVLIALEILANITVYLKRHTVQYELVVITSLIAVARKIIIFDIEKKSAVDLIALSSAVLALSLSYLIIRLSNRRREE
ncbi:MAG: phosphate-starvation-inducible PsiE family protein [Jaaginema sp. PMC 1079.18]|nr:phosphate-starvation-inducible PsiE family protein [Jaaginema sp. PMC 1080.18]MEC4851302.1 phosphate-starvation-inducible PsiE family protein [Jaaginema sp. PMC 1079.18]MEC4867124.1 phosphate-starvation-inducible PsiE family protein [Jaaginema sp. PMC 1078.18]